MMHTQKTGLLFKSFTLAVFGSLTTLSLTPLSSQALTINRNFLEPGTPIPVPVPGFVAGEAPSDLEGGGNLVDIFNVAADLWETSINDEHTIDIFFLWFDLEAIGIDDAIAIGPTFDNSFPATTGFVAFNNNSSIPWFLDATPLENEEYQVFTETSQNLGGNEINVGRVFNEPVGDAVNRYDLLTVATHEIGHALGFLTTNYAFGIPGNPNLTIPEITTTQSSQLPGTVIPTTFDGGGHIDSNAIPTALMNEDGEIAKRKYISDVDVLAVSEVVGFENKTVPEPANIFGMGIVMGLLALLRKRNKITTSPKEK